MNAGVRAQDEHSRRNVLWILPLFLLTIMLLIVVFVGLFLWLLVNYATLDGPQKTAADFASDAERIAFIQKFSPARIPSSATNITIDYGGFQDTHLKTSFVVAPDDFQQLQDFLHSADSAAAKDRYELPGPLSADDSTQYSLNPASFRVEMTYIDP